ncbi:MAG: hypothetical protein BroJett025_06000 [Patescibacteria group bacterium]|nr:MAG: hypothetical protein BroJett025_06000 [Patescibacteria group bacterium]
MKHLVPFRSLLTNSPRWPSIWDDDDFSMLTNAFANNLDLFETDTEVVVKANVAGVTSDDIDVTFEKGVLWIQAQRTEKDEDKQNKYFSKSSWDYSYKVSVPGMLDQNREPEVELEDGVLTVKFHKSAMAEPKKLTVRRK